MGLVRYRSGYSMADLQRVQVQRDFLMEAVRQWKSPTHLIDALRYAVESEAMVHERRSLLGV